MASGRPVGTFGDPVLRVRAWYWLSCLQDEVGVSDALGLDKGPLMKGVARGRRFQSIADDGFDPGRIQITATVSLLDHVCGKKPYRHLRQIYRHDLWHVLQDRSWGEHQRDELIEKALKKVGLVVIDVADAATAEELRLDWQEHFHEGAYGYDPVLLSFKDSNVAESLGTLDGILALVMLYRRSIDTGSTSFAHELYRVLEKACRTLGKRWQGEAADTWQFIAKTRVLAWIPDFEPSAKALKSARKLILAESRAANRQRHGRASLTADQVTSGKVERRWRRRILMRACLLTDTWRRYVGVQKRTRFNEWLTENRRLIGKHLYKAALLRYVGEEGLDDDSRSEKLPDLEIPFDNDHPNFYPYPSLAEGNGEADSIHDVLPMEIPDHDDLNG
jgi:hypothetical protein